MQALSPACDACPGPARRELPEGGGQRIQTGISALAGCKSKMLMAKQAQCMQAVVLAMIHDRCRSFGHGRNPVLRLTGRDQGLLEEGGAQVLTRQQLTIIPDQTRGVPVNKLTGSGHGSCPSLPVKHRLARTIVRDPPGAGISRCVELIPRDRDRSGAPPCRARDEIAAKHRF